MLLKLRPVANFINILQPAFALIFFQQKITRPKTVTGENLCKTLSYENFARKMLSKLRLAM